MEIREGMTFLHRDEGDGVTAQKTWWRVVKIEGDRVLLEEVRHYHSVPKAILEVEDSPFVPHPLP